MSKVVHASTLRELKDNDSVLKNRKRIVSLEKQVKILFKELTDLKENSSFAPVESVNRLSGDQS